MSQKGAPSSSDSKSNTSGKIETSNAKTETKQTVVPELEKSIVDKLVAKFGEKIKIGYIKPLRIKIEVDREDIIEVASFIKDTLLFDHAESVAGTDFPKGNYIEVVYHIGSYNREDL
jgi:NADH-quinone oxidoreductase subunit C